MNIIEKLTPLPVRATLTQKGRLNARLILSSCDFRDVRLDGALARFLDGSNGTEALPLRIHEDARLLSGSVVPQWRRESAYSLEVSASGVEIAASASQGAFYALKTLEQLLEDGEGLPFVKIEDWPSLEFRGFHLTLGSGSMPAAERFEGIVDELVRLKLNKLVLEYDDRFPWKRHPSIPAASTWSEKSLRRIIERAERSFIEVVPLLDSLGHAEPYLVRPEFAGLKERKESVAEMCPSNPATLKFMEELWEEVLDIHKGAKHAHITGDEVFRLGGFCPACAKRAAKGELAKLYCEYYTKLSRWIIGKGKRPIIWGDMLLKHPEELDKFPRDVVVNDWHYNGSAEEFWSFEDCRVNPEGVCSPARRALFEKFWKVPKPGLHPAYPSAAMFVSKGFQVLAATTSSNFNARKAPVADQRGRFANNMAFARAAASIGLEGVLNTFWSNNNSMEGAWFGIASGADFSWNARTESAERFAERFAASFLGASDVSSVGKALLGETSFDPSQTPVKRRSPFATKHAELLSLSDRMNVLERELDKIKTSLLASALGETRPLDLSSAANSSCANCLPSSVDDFKFPSNCEIEAGGLKFKILGGERDFLTLAPCQPEFAGPFSIPVEGRCEALALLSAAYFMPRGATAASVSFHYADGTRSEAKVVVGGSSQDWWGFGLPLSLGVRAWQGESASGFAIALYAGLVENPNPEKIVKRVELAPGEAEKGRLAVLAVSSAEFSPAGAKFERALAESRRMEKEIAELDRLTRKIMAGMMSPADLELQAENGLSGLREGVRMAIALADELSRKAAERV